MITNTGMRTDALTAAIMPALGVVPPSCSASHSSRRPAPPRSAATADSTESTQASTRTVRLGGSDKQILRFPQDDRRPSATDRRRRTSTRQELRVVPRVHGDQTDGLV